MIVVRSTNDEVLKGSYLERVAHGTANHGEMDTGALWGRKTLAPTPDTPLSYITTK